MPLNTGKHIVQEIDGVLCTVVETGASAARLGFLKEILEFNHLEVKVAGEITEEGQTKTFIIGVTDLVFNPVIRVYGKSLLRPDGRIVSPAYWNQTSMVDYLPYFDYRERNADAKNDDEFLTNPWAYRTL